MAHVSYSEYTFPDTKPLEMQFPADSPGHVWVMLLDNGVGDLAIDVITPESSETVNLSHGGDWLDIPLLGVQIVRITPPAASIRIAYLVTQIKLTMGIGVHAFVTAAYPMPVV